MSGAGLDLIGPDAASGQEGGGGGASRVPPLPRLICLYVGRWHVCVCVCVFVRAHVCGYLWLCVCEAAVVPQWFRGTVREDTSEAQSMNRSRPPALCAGPEGAGKGCSQTVSFGLGLCGRHRQLPTAQHGGGAARRGAVFAEAVPSLSLWSNHQPRPWCGAAAVNLATLGPIASSAWPTMTPRKPVAFHRALPASCSPFPGCRWSNPP